MRIRPVLWIAGSGDGQVGWWAHAALHDMNGDINQSNVHATETCFVCLL